MLDATSIFGGVKKNIITKDFKGGDVTSIFGGSEIILSQADIDKVELDSIFLYVFMDTPAISAARISVNLNFFANAIRFLFRNGFFLMAISRAKVDCSFCKR